MFKGGMKHIYSCDEQLTTVHLLVDSKGWPMMVLNECYTNANYFVAWSAHLLPFHS